MSGRDHDVQYVDICWGSHMPETTKVETTRAGPGHKIGTKLLDSRFDTRKRSLGCVTSRPDSIFFTSLVRVSRFCSAQKGGQPH